MNRTALAETAPAEVGKTNARASLYAVLASLFAFPDQALHAALPGPAWSRRLAAALHGLPHIIHFSPSALTPPADYDTFQSEYIRLFEVGGRGGAPCPLHGGHYTGDRSRLLEVLIRFYNFFGLHMAEGAMPDHACVQFEFMQYLAGREAAAATDADRLSLRRAQHDFVATYLANWWPLLVDRMRQQEALAFYSQAGALAGVFLRKERQYLAQLTAKG